MGSNKINPQIAIHKLSKFNMIKSPKYYWLISCTCVLMSVASAFSSCDRHTVYHIAKSLPERGWSKQDTLYFVKTMSDSCKIYELSIDIRSKSDFPYRNLPILFSCRLPDKGLIKDTINIALSDAKGNWLGKGWGGLYQLSHTVGHIQMKNPGIYIFKIAYLLPDKRISGISDIGIRLHE